MLAGHHPITRSGCNSDVVEVQRPLQRNKTKLCGHTVCLFGLARVLGIGTDRATKMMKAIRDDQPVPADGRLCNNPKSASDSTLTWKRELIHSFLHTLYVKLSEPLPDQRRDRDQTEIVPKGLRFRRRKGKRPRLAVKRDAPLTEAGASKLRQLPAGTYTHYWRMLKAEHPTVKISLRLFMRVSLNEFGHWHVCQRQSSFC